MNGGAVWPVARLRVIGGLVWLVAGLVGLAGSFLPLVVQKFTGGDASMIDTREYYPPHGITVVAAAVLLVGATLLALASSRLHPASGPVLASRLLGVGGTGLLVASTAQLILANWAFVDIPGTPDAEYSRHAGLGTWLLIVSSALAIGAIVPMLVPRLGKRGEEPETPPMGIPVVRVLEPETDPNE
jgi:hypothetical protein